MWSASLNRLRQIYIRLRFGQDDILRGDELLLESMQNFFGFFHLFKRNFTLQSGS
jgi:hypothetical protein